ncbi:MAG: hypothetical protein LBP42_00050 [Treponema sp.]|jgi:hypothetical protein|nr:hypothetical protein [Treponema sp.]
MKVAKILAGILLLTGCTGEPKKIPELALISPPPKKNEIFQIEAHDAQTAGEEIPPWVRAYIYEGAAAIERLPEYQGKYIFVAETEGTNVNALRQWAKKFAVLRDLPRLIASRIKRRFTGLSLSSPDEAYGLFFEETIREASDASYYGAIKEADYWLLVQYFSEDGTTPQRRVYQFFILVSIDQVLLRSQINEILDKVPLTGLTREQTAFITSFKENFYDGF